MHVNVNLQANEAAIQHALERFPCGNAERAIELLLQRYLQSFREGASAPAAKSEPKPKKSAKRR